MLVHYCLTCTPILDRPAGGFPACQHQGGPCAADANMSDIGGLRAPSGRVGEPSDIAGAALFLASKASAYINGHCLTVDGGMTIAG